MKQSAWLVVTYTSFTLRQLSSPSRRLSITVSVPPSRSQIGKMMDSSPTGPSTFSTCASSRLIPNFKLSSTRFSSILRKARPWKVPTEMAFWRQMEPGEDTCSPLLTIRALQSTSEELIMLPGQYYILREAQGMTSSLALNSLMGRKLIAKRQPNTQMLDYGQHLRPLGTSGSFSFSDSADLILVLLTQDKAFSEQAGFLLKALLSLESFSTYTFSQALQSFQSLSLLQGRSLLQFLPLQQF